MNTTRETERLTYWLERLDQIAAGTHPEQTATNTQSLVKLAAYEIRDTLKALEPRTITTREEVEALPSQSIVATGTGYAVTIVKTGAHFPGEYDFLVRYGAATVIREGAAA